MTRCLFTIFGLLALLSWCCSSSPEPPASDQKPPSTAKTVESAASSDAAGLQGTEDNTDNEDNTVDLGVRPPEARPEVETLSRPSFPPPSAGAMSDIPAGRFPRGSPVQDRSRYQFAENDNEITEMTAFQMDVLPWPNDPAVLPLTGVSVSDAERLCGSVEKRLCTEVELEYACKGGEDRRYVSGHLYDPTAFEEPYGSPSPFGVFAKGTLLELTSSVWGQDQDQLERIAVRGFAPDIDFVGNIVPPERGRRCAMRWRMAPDWSDARAGFRCCTGPVNPAVCHIERPRPAHSLYANMRPDEFARIIRSIPELEAVHDNPHMFSNTDLRAVLAKRGSDRQQLLREGIHFNWKPLRWIPRQGMELWVAVGRSNRHSFVVALHEVEDNTTYVHESSLIIWDNPVPLSLVHREGHRDEIYWAPCWRCREGGSIRYDEDRNEVLITHRW